MATFIISTRTVAIALAFSITTTNALGNQPEKATRVAPPKHGLAQDQKHMMKSSTSRSSYFSAERSQKVREYLASHRSGGNCPPGLAKKNNGCQPPGQAKPWQRGRPLPADVPYYDVPSALLYELGNTPAGQQIVRVGTDLLLIDAGTRMVVDALEDLGEFF